MALYLGAYQSDRGDRYSGAGFRITLDGTLTSEAIDRQFIPDIFFDRVRAVDRGSGCDLPLTKRYARLLLNTSQWLIVPLPFLPGSTEFNQFFIQAAVSYNLIREVGIVGERITDFWVNFQNGKKT